MMTKQLRSARTQYQKTIETTQSVKYFGHEDVVYVEWLRIYSQSVSNAPLYSSRTQTTVYQQFVRLKDWDNIHCSALSIVERYLQAKN